MLKDVDFWNDGQCRHSELECILSKTYPPRVEVGVVAKREVQNKSCLDVYIDGCKLSRHSPDSGVPLQFTVPLSGLFMQYCQEPYNWLCTVH